MLAFLTKSNYLVFFKILKLMARFLLIIKIVSYFIRINALREMIGACAANLTPGWDHQEDDRAACV
jgi:hypothetical protein